MRRRGTVLKEEEKEEVKKEEETEETKDFTVKKNIYIYQRKGKVKER